jgi:hypothetical protein
MEGVRRLATLCMLAVALGCGAYDPPRDTSGLYAACCGEQGTCVPEGLLDGALSEQLGRDRCERDLVCAPTQLAVDPSAVFGTCEAPGELEGRCVPSCLPAVAAQADRLSRADCEREQLCLPCFDPLTGSDTGACHLGGDPGPKREPRVFATCCEGLGRCVPSETLLPAQRDSVAADVCEGESSCVPSGWLEVPAQTPAVCRAALGGEGRCLPSCLLGIAEQAAQLEQGACAAGELCAPCFDPRDGKDTEACRTPGDEPRDPPMQLAECCDGLGRCIEEDSLAPEQRASLAGLGCEASCAGGHACVPCFDPITGEPSGVCSSRDEEPKGRARACCEGLGSCLPEALIAKGDRERLPVDRCSGSEDQLCVPSAWLSSEPPATCRAPGRLEGRCFPSCLPEVAERNEQLTQSNCREHELCLPCFDPLTGADTEACRTDDDPGPVEAPEPFAQCCGELGRCLPRSVVPEEARASLERESCVASYDALCTPEAWIEGSAPNECRAAGDLEGRCLPRCLPDVSALGARAETSTCPDEHACLPCFDPVSGEETGACSGPGDRGPSEPAVAFDRCCPAGERTLGTCLPSSLVPEAQRASVPAELCEEGFTCAPDALVRTPDVGLAPCISRLLGIGPAQPGACVPECLLGDSTVGLSRASCAEQERCVPCSALPLETAACE